MSWISVLLLSRECKALIIKFQHPIFWKYRTFLNCYSTRPWRESLFLELILTLFAFRSNNFLEQIRIWFSASVNAVHHNKRTKWATWVVDSPNLFYKHLPSHCHSKESNHLINSPSKGWIFFVVFWVSNRVPQYLL